jgi:hypothetical protein
MEWQKAEMPDDALDPNSLVGRIRNAERINNARWDSPMSVEMIGGWITDNQGEPIAEISFEGEEITGDGSGEALPPMPLHVWIQSARLEAALTGHSIRQENAAVIDAARDFLLPEEPDLISDSIPDCPIWARWDERRRLRAQLTEQARIARGES